MPTATWPIELPQSPLLEGFSDVPQDTVLRSEMAALTKQRNKFTAVIYDVAESYLMTPTQYALFRTFFHSTLGNGAAEFLKVNPETNIISLYHFADIYDGEFNGVSYKVKLKMERLP